MKTFLTVLTLALVLGCSDNTDIAGGGSEPGEESEAPEVVYSQPGQLPAECVSSIQAQFLVIDCPEGKGKVHLKKSDD